MDELRWILAGVGAGLIVLIYLWGMRARISEELRKRRRREQSEPILNSNPFRTRHEEHSVNDYTSLDPEHPLAEKVLVDVEITPINRSQTGLPNDTFSDERFLELAGDLSSPAMEIPPESHELPVDKPNRDPAAEASDRSRDELRTDSPERRRRVGAKQSRRDQEPGLPEEPNMMVLLTILAPTGHTFKGTDILKAAQQWQLNLHKKGVFNCFKDGEPHSEPVFSVAHMKEPGVFAPDTLNTLSTPGLLIFMRLPGPLEPLAAVDFMLAHAKRLVQSLGGTLCDEHRNKLTTQSVVHLRSEAAEFERQLRLHQPRP